MTKSFQEKYQELKNSCNGLDKVNPDTLVGVALWYVGAMTSVDFSIPRSEKSQDETDAMASAILSRASGKKVDNENTYLFAVNIAQQLASYMLERKTNYVNFSGSCNIDLSLSATSAGLDPNLFEHEFAFGRTKVNIKPDEIRYYTSGYDGEGTDITQQVSLLKRVFVEYAQQNELH